MEFHDKVTVRLPLADTLQAFEIYTQRHSDTYKYVRDTSQTNVFHAWRHRPKRFDNGQADVRVEFSADGLNTTVAFSAQIRGGMMRLIPRKTLARKLHKMNLGWATTLERVHRQAGGPSIG